ncbi:glycosyltransferase [Luteimonas sp. R10]|uniref:glycosyltransferase n=1 Tax=Luteimonas sp. R10 TaxID=3108176 RepID=UPI00308C7978|nr:glycosyltransferase [Luteimonas sp. R10]
MAGIALPMNLPKLEDHPVGDYQRLARRKGLYAEALRTYLELVNEYPDDRMLDRLLLRTSSRRGVELMALWATHGRMRLADVLAHVEHRGTNLQTMSILAGAAVEPVRLLRLARVLALQGHAASDTRQALTIMRWVHANAGVAVFNRDRGRLYQNLAFSSEEYVLARRLTSELRLKRLDLAIMQADLANPLGPSPFADADQWSGYFGSLFLTSDVEAPTLGAETDSEPFDRLTCTPAGDIVDGPLVSVILTTWQPDIGLRTAISSLLSQSWRNLEIIVVDDASPDRFAAMLHEVEALDPRIRLVRLPLNGGTYLARNAGLRQARGDFVTGQDSDDWSHPRRIELQATELMKNQRLVATTSHALRCDPSLMFGSPGTMPRRENASSLMFRRQPVLDAVGFYDATRKAGDTEFMLRIQAVFGERSHKVLEQNLAMIRLSRGSLSNAEFRPGWRHPARFAYRRGYEYWHSTVTDAKQLRIGEGEDFRRFPLPRPFRMSTGAGEVADAFDVVFADDLRARMDRSRLRTLLDEVNLALDAGLRVGLMHLRSFRDISIEPIDVYWPAFSRLLQEERVGEVLPTDDIPVETLVVRHPDAAMFLEPRGFALRPRKVVVIAEDAVRQPDRRVWFDPVACQRNLRDAFGAQVQWRADDEVGSELRDSLPADSRFGPGYPVLVHARSWRAPQRAFEGRRPIIGRILLGARSADLPCTVEALLAAYPNSGRTPVRFLGGEALCRKVLGNRPAPASWTFVPEDTDPEVFLSGCDFYVHFNMDGRKLTPPRLALQALASGCVLVASKEHTKFYGGAVIGCDAGDVFEVVSTLSANPQKLADFPTAARTFVQAACSVGLFGATSKDHCKPATAETVSNTDIGSIDPPYVAVTRDYVRRALRTVDAERLDATILRTGSIDGRELMAWVTSSGRTSFQNIARACESYRAPARRAEALGTFAILNATWGIRLARILIAQNLLPDDRMNGLSLMEAIVGLHGHSAIPRKYGRFFIDTAIVLGRAGLACYLARGVPMAEKDKREVLIDLAHPAISAGSEKEWLCQINGLFAPWELERMQLRGDVDPGCALFDRVEFDPSMAGTVSGPLVTVVVSAWKPTQTLLSSVRSILSQTWRHLEVIVINDASPDEYSDILARCASLDSRVRIINHPVNKGTYAARNTALIEAAGEFVTFQDADDYSHPRRIELQVKPMIEDPKVKATRSASVRVSPEMILANPGSPAIQSNASSLMFRREEVVEKIGFFDTVRKAADTEYALRIAASFNYPIVELNPKMPLALVRIEAGSLSRSEFKPGWRHEARTAYREAYDVWHEEIRSGKASPYRSVEEHPRSFPAPRRFWITPPTSPPTYDVVFIGDWRQYGGPQKSMIEEIRALHARGFRLAVSHMEAFRFMTTSRLPLCPAVRSLINEGVVEQVLADEDVSVRLAILRYPPILQFSTSPPLRWTIDRSLIVANQAPSELDGSDVRYNVFDCLRNARAMFGHDPVWVPQGPQVRGALAPLIPLHMMDGRDMPGILKMEEWRVKDRRLHGTRPVIGRYSRDNRLKFPGGRDQLLEAYPADSDIDVRIMGGLSACPEILGKAPIPGNWTLTPYGAMDVKAFLASIDFFVYFDSDEIVEAFGRSVLEAISSGCVVILPEKFLPVFGEGALYCQPREVASLVRSIHADPARYQVLSERGMDYVHRQFSHESYVARINGLLGAA